MAMQNGRAAAGDFLRGRCTFPAQEKKLAAQEIISRLAENHPSLPFGTEKVDFQGTAKKVIINR